ncbi:MAG TPA: terminase family protein [Terriglobia bacterium]|nr:terminase family protein [Terriglobia bacterium]
MKPSRTGKQASDPTALSPDMLVGDQNRLAGERQSADLSPFKAAAQLLPYQREWVQDNSPLKIVVKGRQTGYSFAATLRAVMECLKKKTTWIFLSKGERQSQLLMEKVQDHVRFCGMVPRYAQTGFFEGTMTKQLEVRFPNGSVIYGLPANADTARGYSGNVSLDEFAFHADAEKIYAALYPIITRGYGLEVISTPNGQQGKFYELAKAAGLVNPALQGRAGLTAPHQAREASAAWSGHWCDIFRADREGMKVNLELLRAGVDEETWRQEFCCEFLSAASEWIPAELFQSCVSSEASTVLGNREQGTGNRPGVSSSVPYSLSPVPLLYAGWDIARNRDLSVIWLSELVGDVTWTRGVIEMQNMSTPDQLREAQTLMPLIHRMNVDQSGMGLSICETLAEKFPGKVEGVQFTQQTKEAMAVLAKRRMEETKVRIPDNDKIRASFRSVKKTVNAVGQARFDAEHDAKFGHADHWWAFCLAETAAEQPAYHLADVGGLVGVPEAVGIREAIL